MNYKSISIEGNIGVGKTTLAKLLSNDLGYKLILETFENNPFLKDFYENLNKNGWSSCAMFTKLKIGDKFYGSHGVFSFS